MAAAKVRLLLKGELVHEIPFDRPTLRIGRMKENEIVVNNLSVSRFHATLAQTDDGFVLEDLGSENGVWVNGRRVKSCRVGAGDRIQVGKHELQVVTDGDAAAAPAPRGRSDAWDAAATYLAGPETQAKLVAAREAEGQPEIAAVAELDLSPLDTDGEVVAPAAAAPAPQPLDDGVELFGAVDSSGLLAGPDLAEFDVSELDIRPPDADSEDAARAEPEPATVLFEAPIAEEPPTRLLDAEPALEIEPEPPVAAPAPASPAAVHAGLILQRGGRLERVIQWDSDRLTLGRASECEIVLATPEVSRRHAMLVRDDERYEVRDLESINGTFVNGEKVSRRTLKVGDVVRVEDFELTFVLDSAPLGDAVKAEPTPVAEPSAGPDPNLTQIGEMMDLAPFVTGEAEDTATAMSFEPLADDAFAEVPEVPMLEPEPDTMLLSDEPDEEKDLVESPREARVLRLEMRIRMEELPAALREALSGVDLSDLRLPVELRLATEDDG